MALATPRMRYDTYNIVDFFLFSTKRPLKVYRWKALLLRADSLLLQVAAACILSHKMIVSVHRLLIKFRPHLLHLQGMISKNEDR